MPPKIYNGDTSMTFNFSGRRNQKVDSLPSDVDNVIINGKTVIVTLTDERKGVAICGKKDEFDPFVGFCIALHKARSKKCYGLKQTLDSCVENAKKKGYSHAILKNYDDKDTTTKRLGEKFINNLAINMGVTGITRAS